MALVEKAGRPTASLVSKGFEAAWRQSASAFGVAGLPMALVERTLTNASTAEIEAIVDGALDTIVADLTGPGERRRGPPATSTAACAETIAVEGQDLLDAWARMNELFVEREWSDGLPLVPPTPGAVEEALKGTKRLPQEVIAPLAPSFGAATVEKIAINAVMAGCKPEHLPVLIAAVKAIASPRFMLRDAAVSTGGRAPLLLINGPVAQRLWINSGVCALGPGVPSRANTAIGRAFRLIFMNIAGACPGKTDPNTVGLPTKYSLCVAENEQRSPWEPYHVELGYTRDASTVTVKSVYGCTETHDSRSTTPEGIADVAVSAARYTGSPALADWLRGGTSDPDSGLEVYAQHMWLICPDHAATMARGGWSKRDIREYLWRKATITFRVLTTRRELHKDAQGRWTKRPELQWLEDHPDLELPILASPDSFRLAVVGGPGPRGVFFWGNEEAVTEPIEE